MAKTTSARDASPAIPERRVAFAALHHRDYRRYFVVHLFSASGVTVGVVGGLIGVHWSLALSAMILLAVTIALFAFVIPGRGAEHLN